MNYPAERFPGTPKWLVPKVEAALLATHRHAAWAVPLEAIARYESDCDPDITDAGDLRGMMQMSVGQYQAARKMGYIKRIDYHDPLTALVVAIHYIAGDLPGYGGYGGITGLLRRHDRGPGDVLRYWVEHPHATYAQMRGLYSGY